MDEKEPGPQYTRRRLLRDLEILTGGGGLLALSTYNFLHPLDTRPPSREDPLVDIALHPLLKSFGSEKISYFLPDGRKRLIQTVFGVLFSSLILDGIFSAEKGE